MAINFRISFDILVWFYTIKCTSGFNFTNIEFEHLHHIFLTLDNVTGPVIISFNEVFIISLPTRRWNYKRFEIKPPWLNVYKECALNKFAVFRFGGATLSWDTGPYQGFQSDELMFLLFQIR